MAVATATPTATFTTADQAAIYVYGTVAVGASPLTYATGGITMSLAAIAPAGTSGIPLEVTVRSNQPAATANTGAYVYQFAPGTTAANGKLQIFESAGSAAALAELAAAAVPAGVSGDVIAFRATFKKGGV